MPAAQMYPCRTVFSRFGTINHMSFIVGPSETNRPLSMPVGNYDSPGSLTFKHASLLANRRSKRGVSYQKGQLVLSLYCFASGGSRSGQPFQKATQIVQLSDMLSILARQNDPRSTEQLRLGSNSLAMIAVSENGGSVRTAKPPKN